MIFYFIVSAIFITAVFLKACDSYNWLYGNYSIFVAIVYLSIIVVYSNYFCPGFEGNLAKSFLMRLFLIIGYVVAYAVFAGMMDLKFDFVGFLVAVVVLSIVMAFAAIVPVRWVQDKYLRDMPFTETHKNEEICKYNNSLTGEKYEVTDLFFEVKNYEDFAFTREYLYFATKGSSDSLLINKYKVNPKNVTVVIMEEEDAKAHIEASYFERSLKRGEKVLRENKENIYVVYIPKNELDEYWQKRIEILENKGVKVK